MGELKTAKPSLWIRFWAWMLGGMVVWLQRNNSEVIATIAYRDAFDVVWCRVYWFSAIGHCCLNENGTVDPKSQSSFYKFWKKA